MNHGNKRYAQAKRWAVHWLLPKKSLEALYIHYFASSPDAFSSLCKQLEEKKEFAQVFRFLSETIADVELKAQILELICCDLNSSMDNKSNLLSSIQLNLRRAEQAKDEVLRRYFQHLSEKYQNKSVSTEKRSGQIDQLIRVESQLQTSFFSKYIGSAFLIHYATRYPEQIASLRFFWLSTFQSKPNQEIFLRRYWTLHKNNLSKYSSYILTKALLSVDSPVKDLMKKHELALSKTIDQAYQARNFPAVEFFLRNIESLNPYFYRCYRLLVNEILGNAASEEDWKKLLLEIPSNQVSVAKKATLQLIIKLIQSGKLDECIDLLIQRDELYDICVHNLKIVIGVFKLMIKQNNISRSHMLRSHVEQRSIQNGQKIFVDLKLAEIDREMEMIRSSGALNSNSLSEKTLERIFELPTSAENQLVFQELKKTYYELEKRHPFLLDIRTSSKQEASLLELIQKSIIESKPFLLMRLGDGESLGFDSSRFSDSQMQNDREILERNLWYTPLPHVIFQKIKKLFQETLKDTDVIGIPSILRFVADFPDPDRMFLESVTQRGNLLSLQGVQRFSELGWLQPKAFLVEHRCHQVAFTKEKILELCKLARHVLVVSQHAAEDLVGLFGSMKFDCIQVPPQRSQETALPMVIDQLRAEVEQKIKDRSLVLVGAGYAGKSLLQVAKKRGAVALDVGAMADYWIGLKTRQVSDLI